MSICQITSYILEWQGCERDSDGMILSITISFLSGVSMIVIGFKSKADDVFRRESIAIVTIGWIVASIFGALPYFLTTTGLTFTESFFESMSGFTTTGASVITNIEATGHTVLFWRSCTQWIGGMGFLVLFVAILSYTGQSGMSLFKFESSTQHKQGIYTTVRETAITLWLVYISYTVLCTICLKIFGMNFFEAINHSLATMATGGYSTKNASIAAYDNKAIHITITIFMVIASLNFIQVAGLVQRGKHKRFKLDPSTLWFLGFFIFSSIIIFDAGFYLHKDKDLVQLAIDSTFQVASIFSTTGFATADFDKWPTISKSTLLALMIIGGCAGSTAGGIKINRVLSVFKIMYEELNRAFRPNVVMNINHSVSGDAARRWRMDILTLFALAGFSTIIATIIFTLLEPDSSLITAISAVIACLFNIGPGFDGVGPTQNFASFSMNTHILLSLTMLIGRLEFLTAITIIIPAFWKKY